MSKQIGFRTAKLVQEELSEKDQYGTGTTFLFEINGVRMFMGGEQSFIQTRKILISLYKVQTGSPQTTSSPQSQKSATETGSRFSETETKIWSDCGEAEYTNPTCSTIFVMVRNATLTIHTS